MRLKDLSTLIEGGKAVGEVSRIPKAKIEPTIKAFKREVLDKLGVKDFGPIGSVGKKETSGDIDLAVDVSKDFDHKEFHERLSNLGYDVSSASPTTISVRFPIYDEEGNKTDEWAQVDLMFGKKDWLEFGYYAPGETESQYSGAHRNILLAAIIRYARELAGKEGRTWAIDFNRGLSRKTRGKKTTKTGKEKEVILAKTHVTDNPEKVVKLLNVATGGDWKKEDLAAPFERLWAKTKEVFPPETLEKIKEYTQGGLERSKKEVPTMEQRLRYMRNQLL